MTVLPNKQQLYPVLPIPMSSPPAQAQMMSTLQGYAPAVSSEYFQTQSHSDVQSDYGTQGR